MEAQQLFELVSSQSSGEDVPLCYNAYMIPFLDHKDCKGIILNPRSILILRVETRGSLDRTMIWIKVTKSTSDKWVLQILSNSETSTMLNKVVMKASYLVRTISINKRHNDLDFLISRQCTESHIHCIMGEVGPTLEAIFALTAPNFSRYPRLWIILDGMVRTSLNS